jgi:hypothetical protein
VDESLAATKDKLKSDGLVGWPLGWSIARMTKADVTVESTQIFSCQGVACAANVPERAIASECERAQAIKQV